MNSEPQIPDSLLEVAVQLVASYEDMELALDSLRREPDTWRELTRAAFDRYPNLARMLNCSATRTRIVVEAYMKDEVARYGRTWPTPQENP